MFALLLAAAIILIATIQPGGTGVSAVIVVARGSALDVCHRRDGDIPGRHHQNDPINLVRRVCSRLGIKVLGWQ